MQTYTIDGQQYVVPNIILTSSDPSTMRFRICEGDHEGVEFVLSNIHLDDKESDLIWYDLDTWPEDQFDNIKPLVDNLIIVAILHGLENHKANENPPSE